jgi:MEMO1 family protein
LELHLPFLTAVFGAVELIPLVVGSASAEQVAHVLDAVWGGLETLVVVSTDLSHFLDYETAKRFDAETTACIERMDGNALDGERACGHQPLRGLLLTARRQGLRVRTLDVRSSGDTAGGRDRVVGYGSYLLS